MSYRRTRTRKAGSIKVNKTRGSTANIGAPAAVPRARRMSATSVTRDGLDEGLEATSMRAKSHGNRTTTHNNAATVRTKGCRFGRRRGRSSRSRVSRSSTLRRIGRDETATETTAATRSVSPVANRDNQVTAAG